MYHGVLRQRVMARGWWAVGGPLVGTRWGFGLEKDRALT